MPGTCEQFAQAVVTAGVLSADVLQSFWASLPANARPSTADAFAAALVKAGRLTSHQAKQVLASLSGPSFGPAFSALPPGAAPPPPILRSGSVAALPVAVAAPPQRENMAIKVLGGVFATIVAPLVVAVVVNRLSPAPDAPPAPAPQALATATAPAATPVVATTAPVAREPEPERPAPIERPPVTVAPPRAVVKAEEKKVSQPQPPAKPKPLSFPMDSKKVESAQNEWAKFLKVPDTTKNSIGMKLVLIPPGTFSMGNTPKRAMKVARVLKQASELERIHDEMPQHKVTFNRPRLLGLTEVTIGQFGHFVSAARYVTEAEQAASASKSEAAKQGPTWRAPGYPVADDFPVTHVTWNDAVAFCNWLSNTEKFKPFYHADSKGVWTRVSNGDGYRLPTEAEWEYACRAGSAAEFFFGDDPDRLDDHAWFSANSDQAAKAVGLKRSNAFGLRDIYGNAREWCEDWYAADYYRESSPLDPRGPASGTQRVTRGGSWYSGAARARSGDRAGVAPTFHGSQNGFRVLRALKLVGSEP